MIEAKYCIEISKSFHFTVSLSTDTYWMVNVKLILEQRLGN